MLCLVNWDMCESALKFSWVKSFCPKMLIFCNHDIQTVIQDEPFPHSFRLQCCIRIFVSCTNKRPNAPTQALTLCRCCNEISSAVPHFLGLKLPAQDCYRFDYASHSLVLELTLLSSLISGLSDKEGWRGKGLTSSSTYYTAVQWIDSKVWSSNELLSADLA